MIDFLVVGGGPASHAAVEAYREAGGNGSVAIVCGEGRLPYRRPPLSKELLRGELDAAELPMGRSDWALTRGVERIDDIAVSVDAVARAVEIATGDRVAYRTCLLATGSEPLRLPVPGADLPGVHLLRTAADAQAIAAAVDERPGASVAVIGSGFIGCEAAVSLRIRGAQVTLVSDEDGPQHGRLGPEVGARLLAWLQDHGVTTHTGQEVTSIHGGSDGRLTVSTAKTSVGADLVVMAAGAQPRTGLAESAGLDVEQGAIPADASMRTRAAGLLVAGDLAYAHHAVANRRLRVEHWGSALDHGTVAGRVAAGVHAEWDSAPGFWSAIGPRTIKHVAWGDGWDDVDVTDHGDDAFTARYYRDGALAGVLTHEADGDYEQAETALAGA